MNKPTKKLTIYNEIIHDDITEWEMEDVRAQHIHKNIYRLSSVPEFATGFNFGDIVQASFDRSQNGLLYEKTLLKTDDKLVRSPYELDPKTKKALTQCGCRIKGCSAYTTIYIPNKAYPYVSACLDERNYECCLVN